MLLAFQCSAMKVAVPRQLGVRNRILVAPGQKTRVTSEMRKFKLKHPHDGCHIDPGALGFYGWLNRLRKMLCNLREWCNGRKLTGPRAARVVIRLVKR
jgi:hypothetical protein